MKANTQLYNELKTVGNDANLDIPAKSLLKYRKILARILKGCVKEYENISLKDIETKYIQNDGFIENREIHGFDDENGRKNSELTDMLSVLFSVKLDGKNKIKRLEEDYSIEMEYEYREVFSNMCNLSDVYMERGRREGLEKGREEGIVLGREEGRNEGIGIGKIKTLKELVEDGTLTLKAAAEKADMSVEEFKIKIQNI